MTSPAEDKLTRARIDLVGKSPFFSFLSMYLKFAKANEKKGEKCEIPEWAGAGVDEQGNFVYKESYLEKLDSRANHNEVMSLVAHEVLHLALLHLTRRKGKEPTKWNVANDLVVNTILKNNNFALNPKWLQPNYKDEFVFMGKMIKDVSKKSSEELYDEMPNIPEDVLKKLRGEGKLMDEHMEGKGNKGEGERTQTENEWKKRVDEAYENASAIGKKPLGIERLLAELKANQLPWRQLLQNYFQQLIKSDITWLQRSKASIATGFYLPGYDKEKINITVMIDTSGSIDDKVLAEFVSEIIGMARAYNSQIDLNVYCHDTKIQSEIAVREGAISDIKKLKVKGGGGTSFNTPYQELMKKKQKPSAIVWLTDGAGDSLESNKIPIIWVLTKNGTDEFIKKTGKIVRLKLNDEEK